MRINGTFCDAQIGGIAAQLSGVNAGVVYGKYADKVREMWRAPIPSPTGSRPDDSLIFSEPYSYLRIVLNNADWDGVARWYATRITDILQNSTKPPDFWNLSKFNIQSYCDRNFNLSDLRAFTEKCILTMCIADLGNKVGFGYGGPRDDLNLALFFANGLSHNDGQLDWLKSFENAKAGSRYGFCIGWVKEPNKHTASRIITTVGAAFIGAAAFSAFGPAAGSAGGGAGGGGATGGTIGSSAGAIVPAGVETVTVVAPALPAVTVGSVAAGLSAGAVAVAAAPPPLSSPSIETVTVTGATPGAGLSVGEALTAGAVATAATAPALTTPSIETVTVEAPRVEQQPVSPAETAATGLISVGIQYPAITAGSPPNPQYEDSLSDRIKERLREQVEDYGQQWIEDHLKEWLAQQLGRQPTPVEVEQYEDYIAPNSPASLFRKFLPLVLGALLVAALLSRLKE